MLTVTDLFCGAGGSGLGATAVPGVQLMMAANHSPRAIETHQLNFPGCDHDCADISQVEPRRYRRTNILWASPECTNHSIAKGRKRAPAQPSLFDQDEPVPDHVAERSRATMWDVPRFAEVHRYDAVIVENVVDAVKWAPFQAWLMAMDSYGYDHHLVSLNSMHAPAIAAPRAPQSRDRLYVVFWRKGNPRPNLDVRPKAYCPGCDRVVEAVQSFKPGRRVGRYRQQYVYRCPRFAKCRTIVEPFVLPAAAAIDWTLPGQRIGERTKPLSAKTLARIRAGLLRYAHPETIETTGNTAVRPGPGHTHAVIVPSGGTWNEDPYSVDDPFRARTTRENEGLLIPLEGREGKQATPTTAPMRTQTARHDLGLVMPPGHNGGEVAFVAELRGGGSTARDVGEPLATVCANGNHHMLVRHNTSRGDSGYLSTPVTEPARTLTTAGHQSLVGWPPHLDFARFTVGPGGATDDHGDLPPAIADSTFRMLSVGEIQAAMAFTPDYVITGSKREQVRQLGNGVTPPAAEWLVSTVAASLGHTTTDSTKEAA